MNIAFNQKKKPPFFCTCSSIFSSPETALDNCIMSTNMGSPPPPPPPPPPSPAALTPVYSPAAAQPVPQAPTVSPGRPAAALLAELVIFNGSPFKDHWAYFIRSSTDPNIGVYIHAHEDVRNGFTLEIRRNEDFSTTDTVSTKRILLQWIDAKVINETAMGNNGVPTSTTVPVCSFEATAFKIKAPGKSLNSADDAVRSHYSIL